VRVAVLGASGYIGLELVRILLRHPRFELAVVTSEQRAGVRVGEAFPALRGLTDLVFESSAGAAKLGGRAELAFVALPHEISAPRVRDLRKAGLRVLDLSGDFRLRDPAAYARWYGEHHAPELLGEAVYGLPELGREAIPEAQLVAVPGCYPTSALLPLAPFLRAGLVAPSPVIVDSKSGVSGAGRKLDETYLFAELDASVHAYNVGGVHRHVPELEQVASGLAGEPVRVTFVPHLLPIRRGIATSVYAQPRRPLASEEARRVLAEAYAREPFVRVLPAGATPRISSVRGSNFCDVGALVDERTGALVLLSAIDNLVKGGSGQAVQCANLLAGFEETAGLLEAPFLP
jgi:N-acetyl-gamma-glutamyl-phosphate reductase